MIFESRSENDTFAFARQYAEKAAQGDIFCLSGALGSGKTVFAKGFACGLGVKGVVTSPTFTIMNQYNGRFPFYHFDVYRFKSINETEDLGFEEYFFGDGICLIEWAEIIKPIIPVQSVWINIKTLSGNSDFRKIEVL